MILDYGVVDEGPSRIGTLALLSAALKADLQRSINVRDAQSPPPLVSVDVGTISTTVMIEGRSRAVLAAWDRLGGLLAAPGLTVPAEPAPTPRPVWPQDLAAYTGANALTLGDLRIRGPRNLDVADALLAHVAPAACRVRHTFVTDDPRAVGTGWSGQPSYGVAPARRLLEAGRQPTLVPCDRDGVIVSVAVPAGIRGRAEVDSLNLRIGNALADLGHHPRVHREPIPLGNLDVVIFCLADEDAARACRHRVLEQLLNRRSHPAGEDLVNRLHIPLRDDTADLLDTGCIDVREPWLPDDANSLLWADAPPADDTGSSLHHSVHLTDHLVAEGFYLRTCDAEGRMRNECIGQARVVNLDNLAVIVRQTQNIVEFIDHQLNRVPLPWPDIITSPTFKDDLGPYLDALPRYVLEN